MDQIKTSMPPPQAPGVAGSRTHEFSMKFQDMEAMAQLPPEPQVKKHHQNEEESSGRVLEATSPREATQNTAVNPVIIWESCDDQLMKELDATGRSCGTQWSELHEEENAAMARIQQLLKNAVEMNICFHQQLDSLHNTVVDLVSSFKK